MKKALSFGLFEFIFVSVLGTLLHFTYEWSGKNFYVGLFSAVNESVWEHLKLIFFPFLIYNIISFFIAEKKSVFIMSKTVGALSSMLLTVMFFYTYTGILGYNLAFLDILSFYIFVLAGTIIGNLLYKKEASVNKYYTAFFVTVLLFFIISFAVYTYNPPELGIFLEYVPLLKIYHFNSL